MQKLAITHIENVDEVEPTVIEIVVTLLDGSTAILRMNTLTMMALRQRLNRFGE